jgi:hypothetical protein
MAGKNTADHLSGHELSRQANEHFQGIHQRTQAARLDMASPHSDMTTSQPSLVNAGKLEFVEIRRVDLVQRPVPGTSYVG